MVGRRSYDDGCAIAHGLELIGERWALLIVRELLLGPKRFTGLRAGLPGVSPDVLSQRLRELQEAGIVRRRKLPPPADTWVYELTAWGVELEPVVTHLARWSSRSPTMPRDAPIGVDSAVLSLRALFDPQAAEGFEASVALRLGEQRFRVRIENGRVDLARQDLDQADLTLDTDPRTFVDALGGERRLAETLRSGKVRLDGNQAVLQRFLSLFRPPKSAPPADTADDRSERPRPARHPNPDGRRRSPRTGGVAP